MLRRTKIVATLGPACDDPAVMERLLLAGVNVVRINFSHGDPAEHRGRAELVRSTAKRVNRFVAIMGDLQGPKIRVARFKNKSIELLVGDDFILDADLDKDAGDQERVGIDYKNLPEDCQQGDRLLLDDGRLVLNVEFIDGTAIHCKVIVGGTLSNNKGINREGGGLSAPALTEKDRVDIRLAAELEVDFLAVSFPRSADDINLARELLTKEGGSASIVAKIERAEVVESESLLNEVIAASDAVMVARGDLGVEIGDAALLGVQKQIINQARALNKVVITATQMMETMISSPIPTRAEVIDVGSAVLDGTDAVMLSAETAVGSYPVETIEAMNRIILGAEKHPQAHQSTHRINEDFVNIDESIALAAMYTANHLDGVKAIICMTETGSTPRLMSRISSRLPIFAFARLPDTQRRVALYRGVHTVPFDSVNMEPAEINQRAVDSLLLQKVVEDGDLVIISKGDYLSAHGGTNTMKIVRVGDVIR